MEATTSPLAAGPTMCPRSSDPIYVVTYYIKWVTTSWTYSTESNSTLKSSPAELK